MEHDGDPWLECYSQDWEVLWTSTLPSITIITNEISVLHCDISWVAKNSDG